MQLDTNFGGGQRAEVIARCIKKLSRMWWCSAVLLRRNKISSLPPGQARLGGLLEGRPQKAGCASTGWSALKSFGRKNPWLRGDLEPGNIEGCRVGEVVIHSLAVHTYIQLISGRRKVQVLDSTILVQQNYTEGSKIVVVGILFEPL